MKKSVAAFACLFFLSSTLSAQTLLQAVEAKDYKAAETAIKAGENVNATVAEGQFPLWNAIWNGDEKMVALLLKNGADAKQKFRRDTVYINLLEITAQEGHMAITKLLVDGGADVHERSMQGFTPLRIAARNGHLDQVNYYLSKGAEVNTQGIDGATPLEHAASKGHLDIIKALVEKGAAINTQDAEGDFALGEAAKHGFVNVVAYLLSKGADTTLKNNEGNDAIAIARLAGQPKIAEMIRKAKG